MARSHVEMLNNQIAFPHFLGAYVVYPFALKLVILGLHGSNLPYPKCASCPSVSHGPPGWAFRARCDNDFATVLKGVRALGRACARATRRLRMRRKDTPPFAGAGRIHRDSDESFP